MNEGQKEFSDYIDEYGYLKCYSYDKLKGTSSSRMEMCLNVIKEKDVISNIKKECTNHEKRDAIYVDNFDKINSKDREYKNYINKSFFYSPNKYIIPENKIKFNLVHQHLKDTFGFLICFELPIGRNIGGGVDLVGLKDDKMYIIELKTSGSVFTGHKGKESLLRAGMEIITYYEYLNNMSSDLFESMKVALKKQLQLDNVDYPRLRKLNSNEKAELNKIIDNLQIRNIKKCILVTDELMSNVDIAKDFLLENDINVYIHTYNREDKLEDHLVNEEGLFDIRKFEFE